MTRAAAKPGAPIGGEIIPMTASLFACATKNSKLSLSDQEEYFRDELTLIRHGERQDHADRGWRGSHLLSVQDPPLSNAGRMQSFETALRYYALQREKTVEQRIRGRVSFFLVSPFHRCIETAIILNIVAFQGSLAIFINPQLSDWQQSKVFRSPPVLSGQYAMSQTGRIDNGGNGKLLFFYPQVKALRASLVPFLQMRAEEVGKGTITDALPVPPEVAREWVRTLEMSLDDHLELPVWTDSASQSFILDKIEASNPQNSDDGHHSTTTLFPSLSTSSDYFGCGVKHPERRADLLKRCQQVVETYFLNSESSVLTIPASVRASVEIERRNQLPKYFIPRSSERRTSKNQTQTPLALLPPLHVMVVTHGDVIAGLVEICCPKYLSHGDGVSVPYCSITTLTRHNNYYRIPSLNERQKVDSKAVSSANRGHGASKKAQGALCMQSAVPYGNLAASLLHETASVGSLGLSMNWQVEEFGSTDLLRTRIFIRYN
ncbi:unnamed protein product [Phytomonas sp. EM1]|nr:unnamed protein product [Phytomonas sp. EM1]|eukprot:CCW61897.1 unnamed protein product [Phytomonas sp. isolate EM1]